MSDSQVIVEGMLKPDGSLELAGRLPLHPGPVRVTVEVLSEPASGQPIHPDDEGLDDIYRVLSRRYRLGHTDTAERHNEHQP